MSTSIRVPDQNVRWEFAREMKGKAVNWKNYGVGRALKGRPVG